MSTADPKRASEVEIVEFKPKYARFFESINRAWLEEYFEIEPYDRIVLGDPQGEIIGRGGCVLFAKSGEDIIGACALLKHADAKYELAKMGVAKSHRGKGVGRQLALAVIERARRLGADTLVLATSPKLTAANALYHNLGFHEVDLLEIGPLPYKRRSIVMCLRLRD